MPAMRRAILLLAAAASLSAQDWELARRNGRDAARAARFAKRLAWAWLDRADPRSGLLPRNLTKSPFWNAQDAAADNWPFHLLTAEITGSYHLRLATRHILEQERRLTRRLDSLPDDFHFQTQGFPEKLDVNHLIFGAAEYAKDGLIPLVEWLGPGPWLDRMKELADDIWKHAPHETPGGRLPSRVLEVNGDLLQVCSRLYWITGEEKYRQWAFRLAEHYLFEEDLLALPRMQFDDHSCEVFGGLSEAYLIAARTDPERRLRWKPRLHRIFDRALEIGRNADGLFYNAVNPVSGAVLDGDLTDNWGYNYNAILTVAEIDGAGRYREAVRQALERIHRYAGFRWENGGADGYADSIEGAINLLNRIPVESAWRWVDASMEILLARQRPDGLVEGWHGDGNSARTAWMWALHRTQGVTAEPWTDDLELGALRLADGGVAVTLRSAFPWRGVLRFDRRRHRAFLGLPLDYPRINQFPEWFTVEPGRLYQIVQEGGEAREATGAELLAWPAGIPAGGEIRLVVREIQHGRRAVPGGLGPAGRARPATDLPARDRTGAGARAGRAH